MASPLTYDCGDGRRGTWLFCKKIIKTKTIDGLAAQAAAGTGSRLRAGASGFAVAKLAKAKRADRDPVATV
jgi:hypothetical protein